MMKYVMVIALLMVGCGMCGKTGDLNEACKPDATCNYPTLQCEIDVGIYHDTFRCRPRK
jgi:hypothetical protein